MLSFKGGSVEFAQPGEKLSSVAARMSELGISQMPLAANGGDEELKMVHEVDLLQSLVDGSCTPDDPVVQAASMLEGQVKLDDSLSEVQRVFDQHNVAVVIEAQSIIGVISKIDVVGFLAARR